MSGKDPDWWQVFAAFGRLLVIVIELLERLFWLMVSLAVVAFLIWLSWVIATI